MSEDETKRPRIPLSIRLDPGTLTRLKAHAEKLGVGYQTLLKSLLLRGLHDLDNAALITFPSGLRKKRAGAHASPVKRSVPAKAPDAPDPPPVPAARPGAVTSDMTDEAIDDLFQSMG